MFLGTFYMLITTLSIALHRLSATTIDWKSVEKLIEESPYIVALLNNTLEYICTGTIISKRTVLSSGSCVNLNPKRVAVGVAVVGKKTRKSSLLDVAYTRLHGDYNFEMKAADPAVNSIHSNIGLVFVVRPILELFIPAAEIGNYYASELQDVELTTVGYGSVAGTSALVLQHQNYDQAPCANPRWYYCVCGIEESNTSDTYEREFGNGAPVLFGNEVVGVTASASGTLSLKASGIKYNVFTVIAPYLAWIEKVDVNATLKMRARNEAIRNRVSLLVLCGCVLVLVNTMCL